jgi:long-subunit fatty acid transport protein
MTCLSGRFWQRWEVLGMMRISTRLGVGTLALLAGLGAPRLAAQAMALPASDPVGIARSGAGVAYGNNLEAAALNPALVATLRDKVSFFLAAGLEMESAQATLQSNSQVLYSDDRNRGLGAFGLAVRVSPDLALGLKFDQPFMRHARMPLQYAGRFQGQALDLKTRRLEAQVGWAASPNWAFGASLGVTRIQYAWDNMVRSVVYYTPSGGSETPLGLMESDLHQSGAKTVPSYSLGFRWAINSRWTVAGTYVGAIKGTLPLAAGYGSVPASYYTLAGAQPAPNGTAAQGAAQQSATALAAGDGGITLPGKLSLGVRERVNQVFTWELDLRYVLGRQTRLPGYPSATAKGATVSGAGQGTAYRNGLGMSLMGELTLSKLWVLRLGASLDPALRNDTGVDPLVGGAKSAGLSAGFGFKCLGGEVSAGYQYRQSQDVDVAGLEGTWSATGYATTPTSTRVEGMGHLWALGYKRAF